MSLRSSQPEYPRGSLQATNNLEDDLKLLLLKFIFVTCQKLFLEREVIFKENKALIFFI